MNQILRALIAEFVGTFVLVFIGAGAVAVTIANGYDVVVPALAHGLIVIGLIYAYGHISGTHINPAVTLGLAVGGNISIANAVLYVVVQFLGGISATYVLLASVGTELMLAGNYGQTVGPLTVTNPVGATVIEAILTFILVSAIYQTALSGKSGNLAAVAIGFTLTACILAGGPYTGASLNPARTLGPAMAAGDLSYIPLYFFGLFVGGIAAGLFHTHILPTKA